MIYLDNAATSFPKPECVYDTVNYIQRSLAVNVGRGSYAASREATEIVDEVRLQLGKLAGFATPENVVLTPSSTIALNEIIFGLEWDKYKIVYLTPFEHNAVARPLGMIKEQYGCQILQLPFYRDTLELDGAAMKELFAQYPPDYVFVNHISNVTGSIAPIKTIFSAAKEYGAVTVVDASQSFGLIAIDIHEVFADFLVFAGHKTLYAPFGVGGFIQSGSVRLKPVFAGGTGSDSLNTKMPTKSPNAYEFASPNIIAIAGLNASLRWIFEIGIDNILSHKWDLMKRLISGLASMPKVTMYLPSSPDAHAGVLSFNIADYQASDIGMILDQDYGIAVRTGFHCAPYVHKLLGTIEMQGTVRVSLGFFNTVDDIDKLLQAISEI